MRCLQLKHFVEQRKVSSSCHQPVDGMFPIVTLLSSTEPIGFPVVWCWLCALQFGVHSHVSVICHLLSQTGFERGCVPGGGSTGDPESRRESWCGLDEAACEFSGIGHGSIIWKLKARTMHARGHKISNNSPGCFLLVA